MGKGVVNPAATAEDATVRVAAEQLVLMDIDELVPYANNAKIHGKEQIAQIRASLREFGFVTPVLIDFDGNIIAGHGRVEAARAEGMREIPCVVVSNLTEAQRKAYILADNRLSETGAWDQAMLRIELEGLRDMDFDTSITGFDFKEDESRVHFWGEDEGESSEEYEELVDKFKPKLTTDDCYTPDNIYEGIKAWAVEKYGLQGAEIVRPFYPGGDYRAFDYPAGCAVIDNPPFSILSEICRYYSERGIPYFLFAPTLTLFSVASGSCNYLPIHCGITYENGATVQTSFVTNLGRYKIETCPELYRIIDTLNRSNTKGDSEELPAYSYPDCLITAARLGNISKYERLQILPSQAHFVRALDAQAATGNAIFGGGFLLDALATEEKSAAAAAAEQRRETVVWELSPRERAIVAALCAREGGESSGRDETADGCGAGKGCQAPEQE